MFIVSTYNKTFAKPKATGKLPIIWNNRFNIKKPFNFYF